MLTFVFFYISLLVISVLLSEIIYRRLIGNEDLMKADFQSENKYSAEHIVNHFLQENNIDRHIQHVNIAGFPCFSPANNTIYMPMGFSKSVNYYHSYMWLHEYTHYIQSLNRGLATAMKLFWSVVGILKLINYALISYFLIRFAMLIVEMPFPKEQFTLYLVLLVLFTALIAVFQLSIEFHAYYKPFCFLRKEGYLTATEVNSLKKFALLSMTKYLMGVPNLLLGIPNVIILKSKSKTFYYELIRVINNIQ